jgi:hypothetical protein
MKRSKKFMDENHRRRIMSALKCVDDAVISVDDDRTVCKTITMIRTGMADHEFAFFNSGDRMGDNVDSAEVVLCKKLGIKYVAIPMQKVYSSSKLLKNL